jgi:hypothetical protein
LWSVASGNQTVSGGGGGDGGGRDQNQSIPDFVRGYNYFESYYILEIGKYATISSIWEVYRKCMPSIH